MSGVRPWATVTAAAVALLATAAIALALTAAPASAFTEWQHDGATGCVCHTIANGTPTDATCVTCHSGFKSYPGMTCWSCHAPGQDTSTLSSPSSACSQGCHLWSETQKDYVTPFAHGANPHLGSTSACLDCHPTSVSWSDPGSSPHHQGTAPGFSQCGECHTTQQNHVGKVACASCHTDATAFHLYQASSPGFTQCGSCHAMKHAGHKVQPGKCAGCHQGTGGLPVQHSSTVTKKFVCGGCHSNKLHARAVSTAVKSCRTCHSGKYHAAQRLPGKGVCTKCHTSAARHANGFQCTLCHLRAVHATRPRATN